MTRSAGFVPTIHPDSGPVPLGAFAHQDLDSVRLILRGTSVVDWYRLHLTEEAACSALLEVNGFELSNPVDRRRLDALRDQACTYLRTHLNYRLPASVVGDPDSGERRPDVPQLLRLASGAGRRSERFAACLVLKVMHIIQYVEARELRSVLPISNEELAILVRARIERVVRGLNERGFPILEFSGNTKELASLVSKLLARRRTQAAQVFDRLRFRFVVERMEDIPSLVLALSRELFPFNYIVPEQSDNTLIDVDHMLSRAGNLIATGTGTRPPDKDLNEVAKAMPGGPRRNEFSGPDYRVVNFVAEVPVPVDKITTTTARLGRIVYAAVEFQIVDRATARANERGANRHTLYKRRQLKSVKTRLERGKRKTSSVAGPHLVG